MAHVFFICFGWQTPNVRPFSFLRAIYLGIEASNVADQIAALVVERW